MILSRYHDDIRYIIDAKDEISIGLFTHENRVCKCKLVIRMFEEKFILSVNFHVNENERP